MAKLLSKENMEISLLDDRQDRLGDLETSYDILTRIGSPTSINDLKEIRVNGVDLFIAVTPNESENITSCLIANQLGAKKTLARIDNYEYLMQENRMFFEQMGLNHLIYPEVLAAEEIVESLRTNWMRYHLTLCDGALELCAVKVRESAKILNQPFSSGCYDHGKYRIVAIKRDSQTIIPTGTDEVKNGDLAFIICTKENMDFMREELGKNKREIKNIFFYGGSRIAQKAVQSLPDDMNIKILEADKERCYYLSEKLGKALVINVDGRDRERLKEEGIQNADALVAVSDNSEANIFACLAANSFGVKKTIAEIETLDYIPMAEGLDIGTVLNKKTIAASYIYQMLLNASVLNVKNLTGADAQIAEFIAKENSRITGHAIRKTRLPEDATIAGLVRAGEGLLVNGDTIILPNDKVVVLCKSHVIRQLDKYFK